MLSPTYFSFFFPFSLLLLFHPSLNRWNLAKYIFLSSFIFFLSFYLVSFFTVLKYIYIIPLVTAYFVRSIFQRRDSTIPLIKISKKIIKFRDHFWKISSTTIPSLLRSFKFNHVNCRCLELPANDPPREINADGNSILPRVTPALGFDVRVRVDWRRIQVRGCINYENVSISRTRYPPFNHRDPRDISKRRESKSSTETQTTRSGWINAELLEIHARRRATCNDTFRV